MSKRARDEDAPGERRVRARLDPAPVPDDDGVPHLPFELLQYALPAVMSYRAQWALGQTCRRLAATWKMQVRLLPRCIHDAVAVSDERLVLFSGLWGLDLAVQRPLVSLVTDDGLGRLSDLRTLCLDWDSLVTDDCISRLRKLESLRLIQHDDVDCTTLVGMTSLTALDLVSCGCMTDPEPISRLTFLRNLCIPLSEGITDAHLNALTGLTSLDIQSTEIGNHGVSRLVNLRCLGLKQNTGVSDAGVAGMTALRRLDLTENNMITDAGLSRLTALTDLRLRSNRRITHDGIRGLSLLETLDLAHNPRIHLDYVVVAFPALRTLMVDHWARVVAISTRVHIERTW